MSRDDRPNGQASLRLLPSGVPGLDQILGGGLPEYSFNLIAGGPGAGKTTLAQQIVFGNATADRRALCFTVLGEPTLKMLRYQSQFDFFDASLVGSAVEFVNLSEEALASNPAHLLDRIAREVERAQPGIIVVDSFRSIARGGDKFSAAGMGIDHFVQRLAVHLTSWEVTSFLIGEYSESELPNPVFTVADGVLWLTQATDRNSVVRKMQVVKMRGIAPMPGLHTFRITHGGLQVFPRIPEQQRARVKVADARYSTGVPGLDELMGGGIPVGDVVMIAGPAGSGKTTFATQFVAEAYRQGEPVVVAVFEEYPAEYLGRTQARASSLQRMVDEGLLKLIYLRPLDLSVDETLAEILDAVQQLDATRVVIDSLSGFEVALAPAFRNDFQESLYRLVGALTAAGVTVVLTAEVVGGYPDMRFTSERVSFITDDVIAQRYIEIRGKLQKVLSVVKMRGSAHSREFRTYEVGPDGAVVGGPLEDYHGITTGTPNRMVPPAYVRYAGLTDAETAVLEALIRLGTVSREALAVHAGMPPGPLDAALGRIIGLGYAVSVEGENGRVFRAVAQ